MNTTFTLPITVSKRTGEIVSFKRASIRDAIAAAFRAELQLGSQAALDEHTSVTVEGVTDSVVHEVQQLADQTQASVDVERIQDLVEMELMQAGVFRVARRYIVYREERTRARMLQSFDGGEEALAVDQPRLTMRRIDGLSTPIDVRLLQRRLAQACYGLTECSAGALLDDLIASLYDGITAEELERAMVMVARQRIESAPAYSQVATRLVLDIVYREAVGRIPTLDLKTSRADTLERLNGWADFESAYRAGFYGALQTGVAEGRIDPELLNFETDHLAAALEPSRDRDFQYLGVQTLYDRYLLHVEERRIETPQYFWMRVAMGLSLNESDRTARAIEFYGLLSTFRFVSATPTLFNSGTCHPQLSSCYLTTVDDDLLHIFKCVQDNAMLSKWAGGLGNDWTRVRAMGARIRGTNGKSQGIVPFLKVANDAALAVNQGGKRKGAVCAYLETWHLDIEEFIELRKNTGDERRRTHDMHTAHWIPDLFMQRVVEGLNGIEGKSSKWTLFSPNDVPDLHELYGEAFARRYVEYEEMAERGELRQFRRVDAADLWRKMLSMVFETGHPWLTFKDPSNLRSPQDHAGVVHNSNLCTEILLNTSNEETAVCNLGSINLRAHMVTGAGNSVGSVDRDQLAATIRVAVRMLDNVIDINYYPTPESQNANHRHRPIGLGLMGFQDALYVMRMPYASQDAVEFADEIGEFISYHAILSSTRLAAERGSYQSFPGSKWDRGLLPIDTIALVRQARGGDLTMDEGRRMDWNPVRTAIAAHGMRNSNIMAIAPTATISNIAGCTQSIEPTYRNLFVKSNLSGDFTIINEYLIADLKRLGLWTEDIREQIKHHDGELAPIARIPQDIKRLYQTAFEINPEALIEATSRRQKWIDMGISLNLYLAAPSGKALSDMYLYCWRKGLKATYYLRSRAATQVEKSSIDVNKHGAQPKWMKNRSASATVLQRPAAPTTTGAQGEDAAASQTSRACALDDPTCEACQ